MTDIASPTTLDGARVLLIDDVPHNLKLLRFILSKAGATIMEATCADEARAQLTGALPDIILMDILMPGTNGYDLCRQLKAQPDTAHIPVIFLSALNEGMDKAQAFAVGGSDYVTKPYSPPEVLARVTHHVRMVRMQQELAREAKRLAQLNNELVRAHGETRAVFGALGQNLLGQVLDGKYVLQAQIGSGGYAVVYRAIAMGTQQAVAVKVYRPVSEATKAARQMSRFRQEEAATHRVSHPNTVAILDSGTALGGINYLVMELLKGHPLTTEMQPGQPLSLARCMEVALPLCRVLVEAHGLGVVHRDIKPDNIFLHTDDGGEVVKLLDFGIANFVDAAVWLRWAHTQTGEIIGTLTYMSPEQLSGSPCDGRSDVYSLALTVYEMLSGRLPFPSEGLSPMQSLMHRISTSPPLLHTVAPHVPKGVSDVVMGALSSDPTNRPSAAEFLAGLQQATR